MALPTAKIENCQMSNIKHLFTSQSLNQRSFCLVKINPKESVDNELA